MQKRKKLIPFLVLGILSLAATIYFIFAIDPTQNFDLIYFYLPPIIPFFIFLTAAIFTFSFFIFTKLRRPILITTFITGTLLLRSFGFHDWIPIAFLLIILVLIEIFFEMR